jgi:ketosteroid isomerase-like protein
MSREESVAHAEAILDAFQRGDIEALLELLDPEVEIFSAPALANAGYFHGREGYLQWSRDWFEAWDEFAVEAVSIEPVGEHHVLTFVHQRGRGKGSGVEVEMEACYMGEIHGGQATRFHLYPNLEQAREAALAGERSGAAEARGGPASDPD